MKRNLVEEARIKALNVLLAAAIIGFVITAILTTAVYLWGKHTDHTPLLAEFAVMIGPISTYIVGRILCFKEYKDEIT